MEGARGIVVFDGVGEEKSIGALEVRYAPHADALLERLAAEHRGRERVCLVSSDAAVRGTAGVQVKKLSSATFLGDLEQPGQDEHRPARLEDRLDDATRARPRPSAAGPGARRAGPPQGGGGWRTAAAPIATSKFGRFGRLLGRCWGYNTWAQTGRVRVRRRLRLNRGDEGGATPPRDAGTG